MPHPGPSRHILELAGPDHAAVPQSILMLKRARDDVADDFHVAVGVQSKTAARSHAVVIDDAEAPEAHPRRIVVIGEAESVMGLEPAVVSLSALARMTNRNHDRSSSHLVPVANIILLGLPYLIGMLIATMELLHLKDFVAVAEEQNVTRAAARLHVSQPPLSRQVQNLEEELGVRLFERSAKSLRLTDAGRVFLTEARAVLQRADTAVNTVRAVATGQKGKLHVGYAPSLTVEILPQALREFQQKSPGTQVVLHDLSTQEILAGLKHNCLDLAVLVRPPKAALRGLRFEELRRYPLCVAVAATHPLARRRQITLASAVSERLIAYSRTGYPEHHAALTALFATVGRQPPIAEEHDSATSLIAAVEAGRGVAIVPQCLACLAGPRLKLRPVTPPPAAFVVGLIVRNGKISSVIETFLTAARGVHSQVQQLRSVVGPIPH